MASTNGELCIPRQAVIVLNSRAKYFILNMSSVPSPVRLGVGDPAEQQEQAPCNIC
jgi:hypothetical protein